MVAEREKDHVADPASHTVGAFSSSRFIIAAMAMLTAEYEAVDLSLLLNEGVVGLSQTALRLAGLVHSMCVDFIVSDTTQRHLEYHITGKFCDRFWNRKIRQY